MDDSAPPPNADLVALHEHFREVKHSINNSLAVIMALAELAEKNPAHFEKLVKAVGTRGPDIVSQLQSFQQALLAKMKPGTDVPQSPPTSAVF